jgi:hypothetical protein
MGLTKALRKRKDPEKGPAAAPTFTRIILRVKVVRSFAPTIVSQFESSVNRGERSRHSFAIVGLNGESLA